MSSVTIPSAENNFLAEYVALLISSFRFWTGRNLVQSQNNPVINAEQVFNAPFAVMSHDTSDDPVFNYANKATLDLFEMDWEEFTGLPSRKSAESENQQDRTKLLDKVTKQGFADNYSGIRISASGKRFRIKNAVIWNVVDDTGQPVGQAATFSEWEYI